MYSCLIADFVLASPSFEFTLAEISFRLCSRCLTICTIHSSINVGAGQKREGYTMFTLIGLEYSLSLD